MDGFSYVMVLVGTSLIQGFFLVVGGLSAVLVIMHIEDKMKGKAVQDGVISSGSRPDNVAQFRPVVEDREGYTTIMPAVKKPRSRAKPKAELSDD